MTQNADKEALELAMQAALAARKPTFLASLPRALKLGLLGLLVLFLVLPFIWGGQDASVPVQTGVDEAAFKPVQTQTAQVSEEKAGQEGLGISPETAPAAGGAPELPAIMTEKEPVPAQMPEQIVPEVQTRPLPDMSAAQKQAAERNDSLALQTQLSAAPEPAVAEKIGDSILPKSAADGRKPWRVYARPFDELDPRPRIAVVIVDMGLSRVATDAALRRMPPNVTLVFDAQGDDARDWLQRARHDGHETVLSIPMEPIDYPRSDPGPNTLLTSLPNSDNLTRFFVALKSGTGYVGVTSLTGSRFATDAAKLQPVMEEVRSRGLLILDTRTNAHSLVRDMADKMGIPYAVTARSIDENPAPYAIDAALAEIEQRARTEGAVVVIASPLPSTLDRLEVWIQKIAQRGVVLAPLSAVVQ